MKNYFCVNKNIKKMIQNKRCFDLSNYLVDFLKTNEPNDTLRRRLTADIEDTRKQISEQLISFDIDLNELNDNYKTLVTLKQRSGDLEAQLKTYADSHLMADIDDLNDMCHQSNDRMVRCKRLTHFVTQFREMYSELNSIDQSFGVNSYEMSVQHMANARQLYRQLIQEIDTNDDLKGTAKELRQFLSGVKNELTLKREELIYNTKQLFNSNVKAFKDVANDEYVFEFNLINYLKSNDYKNFINSFIEIPEYEIILKHLIKTLNEYFVKNIVEEKVNQLSLEDNKIIATKSKPDGSSSSVLPLSLLKTFFDYLNQLLTDKNEIREGRQLLKLLGQHWTEDILNQILNYYLRRLMPKTESEIKQYLTLIDAAEDIRCYLQDIGFIDENNMDSPFVEFALNIGYHFSRKLCTDFLIEAKTIISRDLHQTVEVGTCETTTSDGNHFPVCRVSQLVVELKQLVEDIHQFSIRCSEHCCQSLLQTIADIVELFIDMSPIYHKKLITEFPQQNAIFHNNCLYLANFIETLPSNSSALPLLDPYRPILRQLGSQVFLKQMKSQEKIILDLVQSQQFAHCVNDLATEDTKSALGDQLAKEFRRILNQCLVHLNFLKNALIDVLPEKVYHKAIGTLVNSLFNELIHKITIQNDISSSGASRLSTEIEFLLKEIQLFLDTENPMRLVSKWSKLTEMKFILNASLVDIVNRWADGCGILAVEFSAQDVKQLIRVLFQNTERRAQALNRITSK
ncbi:centromere/kinetochore protein zw10 homolog [Oppia nitens]|uniref:centromere/kinetochore protein zw10 homolog n=1 Tax=Oppia nitens TaxID=1686743 RepID=UPI0023DC808A|nr:centromere/kinetochore protein zw10 homolog [Oppia nitens]